MRPHGYTAILHPRPTRRHPRPGQHHRHHRRRLHLHPLRPAPTRTTATAETPLLYGGGYTDTETGFIYLIHRYYDPTTAQFTTLDPLASLTQSPYGYTYGDPLNASDASGLFCMTGVAGHNSSGGEICNGKKEVWNNAYHPLRAVATAPVSLSVFAANKWAGKDCRIDGAQWVAVCTRAFTFGDATATTFGTVINTRLNYKDFMAYNNGQLFSHELKTPISGPCFKSASQQTTSRPKRSTGLATG